MRPEKKLKVFTKNVHHIWVRLSKLRNIRRKFSLLHEIKNIPDFIIEQKQKRVSNGNKPTFFKFLRPQNSNIKRKTYF
jgi:hypothetical protein